MKTKKSDTMNMNINFGQCRYNSNVLQDTATDSTSFGGFFSIYNLLECRLCTDQHTIMMLTSIFDNQCANRYLKMIEMCLPVKMHKNDGLPHYICCSCFVKLEKCYESLNNFRNAYNIHREKIVLTDEQSQIDTTSVNTNTVMVSSETKSNASNNNDINIQNDNKINIKKQAVTYVKKKVVKNDKEQCRNKDKQDNRQSLDVVVGSIAGESDGQVNNFSAGTSSKECISVNTDTADVCSVKYAETERRLDNDTLMSTAGMDEPKIRPKKTNELTSNAESENYQVQHRDNSPTFAVNIVTQENTSSAAPLKVTTNNDKLVSGNKIKLIYECSFCSRWLTTKKRLVQHCIFAHKTAKDEKIICRQLKTVITDVDKKDSKRHQYAYECGQCSKRLTTKGDLISHCLANKCLNEQNQIVSKQIKLKSMRTEVRYQCEQCNASFTKAQARRIHTLECHSKENTAKGSNELEPGEVRYQSKQCNVSFTEPQARITHTLECHSKENTAKGSDELEPGEVRYQCKQCNASFTEPQARMVHTLAYHSKQSKAKDTTIVKPADQTPEKSAGQHLILRTSHKSNNSCLCMYCGVVRRKISLIEHERIHTNERPYQCAVCLKTFRTAAGHANHKEIHNNYKKYICHQCGRPCNTQKRLSAHMKTHMSMAERPFECEVCGKRFGRSDHYKQHKLRHTEIVANEVSSRNKDLPVEYKCLICDKMFKTGAGLKVHMDRAHVNKVQYNCHECGKTFNRRYKLTKHRYLHTGEKPFKCNLCDKAFRCRSTQCQHMLVHKSEAPYMCDTCGKRFKRPGHLKLHKQTHSNNKSYKCNVCDKVFLRQKGLSDHQKKHTGVELKTEVVVSD